MTILTEQDQATKQGTPDVLSIVVAAITSAFTTTLEGLSPDRYWSFDVVWSNQGRVFADATSVGFASGSASPYLSAWRAA